MKIDRRITNGLAWAGVLLVVGIPAADLVSAQFIGAPATPAPARVAIIEPVAPIPAPLSQRPAAPVAKPVTEVAVAAPAQPVVTAPVVKPVTTPAAQTADAVDAYLQSGRQLPSYITGADTPVAAPTVIAATPPIRQPVATSATTPAPTSVPVVDPVEVAAIGPQKTAPIPMPLSMRPRPVTVPLATTVLPAGIVRPPADVTADDLDDWETGPLSDFLARRQQQAGNIQADPTYDADGFFLDEGPNHSRARIIRRESEPFFLFAD